MSHKTLNQLSAETVKLITSTQIITSVSTAVKELIENSLDADSRNIQVRLENYGFDLLEVKDDGHGVAYNNVQRMFLSGYTSKIACFNDLDKLQSYGFRGEALFALAKLSNVTITTKTSTDNLAMTYTINNEGFPESSKPSHLLKGTIVSASNIFGNLPVRKQYLSSKKKAVEELKKVEYVVQSLSAIHPELRISLVHNKCPIWQKNSVKGIKQSFMQVVGLKTVSKLEHLNELTNNILIDLIVPKKGLENIDHILTSSSQSFYMYVNRRPVMLSKISKVVMEHVLLQYSHLNPANKHVVCLISVEVPPQEIDVNVEPNKTRVFLKNESEIINFIDSILSSYYEQKISRPNAVQEEENLEVAEKEEDGEFSEEEGRKRPRLDNYEEVKQVGHANKDKEFREKNNGWRLDIQLVDDPPQAEITASDICSQINKENCMLTTASEVGELKRLVHENKRNLVTSLNSDFDRRLEDRNEIQNYSVLKSSVMVEETKSEDATKSFTSPAEKPILPSWPVRQIHDEPVDAEPEEKTSDERENNILGVDVLDNINLQDWSRGTVKLNDDILEGGVTLARPLRRDNENSEVLNEDVEQFDMSVRSISSQMGKKELSAFTKFARIMRPRILKEFPGIIFTKVSGLLVDRWKALPQDERKYYEKLSKVVDEKRVVYQEAKAANELKASPPKKKPRKEDKKPTRFEVKITASFEEVILKRSVKWKDVGENEIRAIGQLQPSGNWLYKKGNEIGHVRHHGLQELILSQKMLSNYSVPREPAPKAMLINEEILGRELWNVLIGLDVDYDPISYRYTVISPVIAKNGFKIDLEKHEDVFRTGWITDTASMIPFYGVAELRETLNLYKMKGEIGDLGSLRPTAVINYITNEAIRIVREMPRPPDQKDIKDWIDTWQIYLNHLPPQCLHCNDIFVPVYHLQNGSDAS